MISSGWHMRIYNGCHFGIRISGELRTVDDKTTARDYVPVFKLVCVSSIDAQNHQIAMSTWIHHLSVIRIMVCICGAHLRGYSVGSTLRLFARSLMSVCVLFHTCIPIRVGITIRT